MFNNYEKVLLLYDPGEPGFQPLPEVHLPSFSGCGNFAIWGGGGRKKADLATVLHILFTLGLEYCNKLFMGLPLKTAWKLEMVQIEAVQVLSGAH